jgi:hypothetical protein
LSADVAVQDYIEHLQDFSWLAQQLDGTTPQDVEHVVLRALTPPLDPETTGRALLFVQDAGTLAPPDLRPRLGVAEPSATVLAAMEALVSCSNYVLRRRAVYTLAKICSFKSAAVLAARFEACLETDPLLLPNLVSENAWLRGGVLPGFPERLLHNAHPLTRWALVPLLYERPVGLDDAVRVEALRRLMQDRVAPIGEEAAYGLAVLKADRRDHTRSRAEARALRQEAEELRPAITFEDLELRFSNAMAHQQEQDYTMATLARFAERELVLKQGALLAP